MFRESLGYQDRKETRDGKVKGYALFVTTCDIRVLSNEDDNGNENGKKVIGLDWQNNKPARARRFFVHFFDVVTRLIRETS